MLVGFETVEIAGARPNDKHPAARWLWRGPASMPATAAGQGEMQGISHHHSVGDDNRHSVPLRLITEFNGIGLHRWVTVRILILLCISPLRFLVL